MQFSHKYRTICTDIFPNIKLNIFCTIKIKIKKGGCLIETATRPKGKKKPMLYKVLEKNCKMQNSSIKDVI